MEPIVIGDWLCELGRGEHKLQNGTRLKMRNIMSVVFRHGRHGFLARDAQAKPIKYVRQRGRSSQEHTIHIPYRAGPYHGLAGRYHGSPGE
ncbi:hypothetical protein [Tunturiibacter gelidiferens]|uniref:hypothetical protein n=1 Tax=Tunturiibacter gelidiferens TaxID=3069689 RepID=UPI003D9BFCE9